MKEHEVDAAAVAAYDDAMDHMDPADRRDAFIRAFKGAWQEGYLQRESGQPEYATTKTSHTVEATCLELPWGMMSWQPLPGGTMVTFFHVIPPPAGVIGAEPRSIPASTVFLPGIWITRAVNDKGQVGTYAIAHGVTLEELGLTPPPVKKPVLGEES